MLKSNKKITSESNTLLSDDDEVKTKHTRRGVVEHVESKTPLGGNGAPAG